MTDEILRVHDLAIGYGRTEIASSLSLEVRPGDVLRVAGPNGTGKSTLARTLAGVLPPLQGEVFVGGHSLRGDPAAAKRLIGYSSGDLPYTTLTGRDHLEIAAALWGAERAQIGELLDAFPGWPLMAHIDEQLRVYSQGTQQQLAILVALISDPALLILDEAFDNIDDETLAAIFDALEARVARGTSLVYISHRHEELWTGSTQRTFHIDTKEGTTL